MNFELLAWFGYGTWFGHWVGLRHTRGLQNLLRLMSNHALVKMCSGLFTLLPFSFFSPKTN